MLNLPKRAGWLLKTQSSRLSEELLPEREQLQPTPYLFRGHAYAKATRLSEVG